ncbi:MAG: hypothetical protein KH453_12935 [[Eubacterium] siraeum]|nr:hypothetical protein [[Eubacterium] siraeum]
MSKTEVVKGYKVFNSDWTCRGKQYTCPGKFEEDVTPIQCRRGMHFCKKAADCFNYYLFDQNNKVAEVIAYGEVSEEGDKCATNKLEVVREIPWSELLGLVNTGKGCTGRCNRTAAIGTAAIGTAAIATAAITTAAIATVAIATAAIGTAAIGTSAAFLMVVLTPQARKFTCSISRQAGHIVIG